MLTHLYLDSVVAIMMNGVHDIQLSAGDSNLSLIKYYQIWTPRRCPTSTTMYCHAVHLESCALPHCLPLHM